VVATIRLSFSFAGLRQMKKAPHRLNFWEAGMHEGTPTGRDPSPAARVGYHSGKGLATKITCADCRES
jgi:hypothetical protein